MRIHELKCNVVSFNAIVSGSKRHEVRRTDDRRFEEGDLIPLRAYLMEYIIVGKNGKELIRFAPHELPKNTGRAGR